MKIFIDARMINMSGIGRYIKNILKNNKYKNSTSILLLEKDKYSFDTYNYIIFNTKIYGLKEQLMFPYNKLKGADLLHIPHYNIPILYSGKIITTIHDITHILFPEYLPNKFALFYAKFMINKAISKSEYILTVSENTKNDLIKYFNAKSDKIVVTYNGVEEIFRFKDKTEYLYLYDKYNICNDKKIILYVGNKKPHKNIARLLKALALINKENKYILILTGKGFESYKDLEYLSKELNLEDSIIHTGEVNDEELVDLYNLADLFVFPSIYEGFGIPPLEAMACGTPVVCSNTSSLPEVIGDGGVFFNPYDELSIAESIELVLNNRDIYERLVDYGYERVRLFTWEKCRNMTENVYNNILNNTNL